MQIAAISRAKLLANSCQDTVGRITNENTSAYRTDEYSAVGAIVDLYLTGMIEYVDRAIVTVLHDELLAIDGAGESIDGLIFELIKNVVFFLDCLAILSLP